MNRDQNGDGSFDPRTWGSDAPATPDTASSKSEMPSAESDSFDPRAWGGGTTTPPAPPPATPRDPTSFDPRDWGDKSAPPPTSKDATPAPAPAARRPGLLAPVAASLAILLAGAATAWTMRPPAAASPAAAVAKPPAAPVPLAPTDTASRRTLVVTGPDDILPTLTGAGLTPSDAKTIAFAALMTTGREPGEIRLVIDLVESTGGVRMSRLEATRADGSGAIVTATTEGYANQPLEAKLTTVIQSARGEMDATSFYSSAVSAGITDSLIGEIAKAFAFDFDFQQEIAPGDIFEAAWEQAVNPAGDPVGPPTLIYAQMVTAKKSKALYRYLAPGDTEAGWYDGNGGSTVRALMRTPVDGARISSKFGFRKHPIQGYQKLHRGTDFAAPAGTPMYASGNGVAEVAAPRGCAGNFVVIKHDNGWQTRYMHLRAFAPGLAPGVRLTQGQLIGEVGNTGCSTGPHLHYEVWIDGEPVDPQSIDTGTGKQLSKDALAAFRKERDRIDLSRSKRAQ